jgi:hypothetical protein
LIVQQQYLWGGLQGISEFRPLPSGSRIPERRAVSVEVAKIDVGRQIQTVRQRHFDRLEPVLVELGPSRGVENGLESGLLSAGEFQQYELSGRS